MKCNKCGYDWSNSGDSAHVCGPVKVKQQEQSAQYVGEPCGWQFYQDGKWHNGMETNNHRANTEASGVPVRDVYPATQQRKPLTDEQAMDAYCETPPFGTYKEAFIAGIRFIEAAHGIKE